MLDVTCYLQRVVLHVTMSLVNIMLDIAL